MKDKVFFTAADKNNIGYARKLVKSLRYFDKETPIFVFTNEKQKENLPQDCIIRDITKIMANEPNIWYMQKPYFANLLFQEGYDAILGMDADEIVLGDISYMFDTSADIGTVLNFNPLDFKTYGPITVPPIHYATEYFNCGLVLMKNHKMVKHWLRLCQGNLFSRLQYREQDLLNIIAYFGEYEVDCFDDFTTLTNYPPAWHGLLASSETLRAELRGKDIVIPANPENGYPNKDVLFKVWHPASGQTPHDKLNYKVKFQEPVIERINEILK